MTGARARQGATLLSVVGLWLVTCAPAAAQTYLEGYRGPYRGRIVDAETREPLAGVVVVAFWRRERILPLHTRSEFYAAQEALTDTDGQFVLDAKAIESGAPERTLPPYFEIFLPGYASLRHPARFARGFQKGRLDEPGVLVGLPRLSREERLENLLRLDLNEAPYETVPNFIRLINIERAHFGYGPVYQQPRKEQP
jgi:hypothetical protein